jgi:hypothetical protein
VYRETESTEAGTTRQFVCVVDDKSQVSDGESSSRSPFGGGVSPAAGRTPPSRSMKHDQLICQIRESQHLSFDTKGTYFVVATTFSDNQCGKYDRKVMRRRGRHRVAARSKSYSFPRCRPRHARRNDSQRTTYVEHSILRPWCYANFLSDDEVHLCKALFGAPETWTFPLLLLEPLM